MSSVESAGHLDKRMSGGISSQMGDTNICDKEDVMPSLNIQVSQVIKIVRTKIYTFTFSRCRIMVLLTI